MLSRFQTGAVVVLVTLCLLGSHVVDASELHVIDGATMGTTYQIKWIDPIDETEAIQQAVDEQLIGINKMMSTYDPESELSRFNHSSDLEWFAVSTETAIVVQSALAMSQLSDGAFDPTVGRLVRLWNFGSDPRTSERPTAKAIDEALKSVGYQFVDVRLDPPAIRKSRPAVELDLSAIAKGYGVDRVIELLDEKKISNCMVEIGGEVRVSGSKNGTPWTLGIERPEVLSQSPYAKVELSDQALATSGNYRNYFEVDGVRYSHTIDPRTGRPVTHQLASASVLADNCMQADAWATTLMVLGSQEGLKLADKHNMAAYLLDRNGDDFQELASKAVVGQFVNLTQVEPADDAAMSPLLSTFLLAMGVFGVAIAGLAMGVILSNRTLKGSCGGVAGTTDEEGKSICELCTTPPEECDQFKEKLREQLKNSESEPTT